MATSVNTDVRVPSWYVLVGLVVTGCVVVVGDIVVVGNFFGLNL